MNSPLILTPRQWTKFDRWKSMFTFGGRKRGTTGGSLVSDLSALKKTIVLCGECQGKFDWRRHHYYSVRHYEHKSVLGDCDVCRARITGKDGRLFLHEDTRDDAWVTPDEYKSQRKTMIRLAQARH